MVDVRIAVAKTNKYASKESGDTVEVIERPLGGFSVVLADGQGSGRSAKSLSHLVTTKAVSLIKDGVRDGAVARAVNDYLYSVRGGRVSATLVILSVDLLSGTLVLARNSHCPVLVYRQATSELTPFEEPSNPLGVYTMTRPSIIEMPLEGGLYALTYSDGLMEAGKRDGKAIDIPALFRDYAGSASRSAAEVADYLLAKALEADANRPSDDMAIVVLHLVASPPVEGTRIVPQVRRMELYSPL